MKEFTYIPQITKILKREHLTPETIGLSLSVSSGFSFHPGQFVMLGVLGFGEIPIGITTSPEEKGVIEVAVRSAGVVSQKLCGMQTGDELTINGPFGNGFLLSEIKGRDIVLVAGGVGLPPLRSLIKHIEKNPKLVKSLTVLVGARTPDYLLYKDEYAKWEKFATVQAVVDSCDSEWKGCTGMITKLFDLTDVKAGSVMIVCGPPVMYPSVIKYYAGKRVAEKDLYFLLERRMKCGIGKCQHCTCGELYACVDGPVFPYDKIKYNTEAFTK